MPRYPWIPPAKARRIPSTRPVTILDTPPAGEGYEYRASYCGIPLQVFSQRPINDGNLLQAGDTIIARWIPGAAQLWFPSPVYFGGVVEVLATNYTKSGVYYTRSFLATSPIWIGSNIGMPANKVFTRKVNDPYSTDRAVICGNDGIYMNNAVKNGGAWSQIFSEANLEALLGFAVTGFYVRDVHFSITVEGSIWALITVDSIAPMSYGAQFIVIHTHNYGAMWFASNYFPTGVTYGISYPGDVDLEVSQHNPNFVWCIASRCGPGATGATRFFESTDGGHSFGSHKSSPGFYANGNYGIHVPYHDNDDDAIIWVYGAHHLWSGWLMYSSNRGTTWVDKSDGTALCAVARGGHNLITNNTNRQHVYAANPSPIDPAIDFYFSKDEGATWPAVARPFEPASFAMFPQAFPSMVLYTASSGIRSSQDDGATWIVRNGNLLALYAADGMAGAYTVTITPRALGS